jgi:hypothetical protein
MAGLEDVAKEISSQLEDALSKADELGAQKIGQILNTIREKFKSSPEIFNLLTAAAKSAFKKLEEIAKESGSVLFNALGSSIDKIIDKLPELGSAGIKAFSVLYLSTQEVSAGYKKIGDEISSVSRIQTDNTNKYIDLITKQMPKGLGDFSSSIMKGMISQAEAAKNAESSLYNYYRLSGMGSEISQRFGESLEFSADRARGFSEHLYKVANEIRTTSQNVAEWAVALRVIPGIENEIITLGTSEVISATGVAMQVAAQYGLSAADAANKLKTSWENFGLSGKDAIQVLSLMGAVMDQTGIPMAYVDNIISTSRENFKSYGDSADGAANMVLGLGSALKETGTAPAVMRDMLNNITGAISKLDVGTKAFLATQAGFGSGLSGAFKFDKLMVEGKIDEAYKMMEDTIRKQMGGKIYTLDEASTNEAAAQQYQKQTSLMQQFGLIKDSGEAARLSKAWREGTSVPASIDKSTAMEQDFSRGQARSERYDTALRDLNNNTEMLLSEQNRYSLQIMQSSIGTHGVLKQMLDESQKLGAGSTLDKSTNEVAGVSSEEIMGRSVAKQGATALAVAGGVGTFVSDSLKDSEFLNVLKESIAELPGIGAVAAEQITNLQGALSEMSDKAHELTEKAIRISNNINRAASFNEQVGVIKEEFGKLRLAPNTETSSPSVPKPADVVREENNRQSQQNPQAQTPWIVGQNTMPIRGEITVNLKYPDGFTESQQAKIANISYTSDVNGTMTGVG